MKKVFADTSYWIALMNRQDQHHQRAVELRAQLAGCRIVTSEMVLVEFLNFFSERDQVLRANAVDMVDEIIRDSNVTILRQTHEIFDRAFELYRNRLDKGYRLTDCSTMVLTGEERITEVLYTDPHFEQHGLTILLQ